MNTPAKTFTLRIPNRPWFVGLILILPLSVYGMWLSEKIFLQKELIFALCLTYCNAFGGVFVLRRSVTGNPFDGYFWGLAVNGIRYLTVLILILLTGLAGGMNNSAFCAAFFPGFFCMLFAEILCLHSAFLEKLRKDERRSDPDSRGHGQSGSR